MKHKSKFLVTISEWHRPARQTMKRIIGILISMNFLFPYLTWAFEVQTFQGGAKPVFFNHQLIDISPKYGKITDSFQGNDKLVIHIQDLHCNYEVQSNIARLIDALVKKYNLRLIGIEGASQVVNVTKLSTFPVQTVKEKVGDYFMKQGKMSGTEFYAATGRQPVVLKGIETPEHYAASRKCVASFLTDESSGYVLDLREAFNEIKPQIYDSRLLKFDHHKTAYQNGTLSLLKYAGFLVNYAAKQGVNLNLYPYLQCYVSKRMNVFPLEVDTDKLFDDLERLDLRIRHQLYTSNLQQELDELLRRLNILEKLINASASPAELAEFRAHPELFQVKQFMKFLTPYSVARDLDLEIYSLDEKLLKVKEFYMGADIRSIDFVKNLLQSMNEYKTRIAVLPTGGYHTSIVLEQLRKQGISYISIKPRITHFDNVNPYFSLLKNRHTPLEKLLAQNQEKIALAPFFMQWSNPDEILHEADLPKDVKIAYQILDMTLKLMWLNELTHKRIEDVSKIKVEFESEIARYRANNPDIKLDIESIRRYKHALLVPLPGNPFFAAIHPQSMRKVLPKSQIHVIPMQRYQITFFKNKMLPAVAKAMRENRTESWISRLGSLIEKNIREKINVIYQTARKSIARFSLTDLLFSVPNNHIYLTGAVLAIALLSWIFPDSFSFGTVSIALGSMVLDMTESKEPSILFFRPGMEKAPEKLLAKLGSKGRNLYEMSLLHLPVPPGFTISTDVSKKVNRLQRLPVTLKREIRANLKKLASATGQKLGDPYNPLFVSVRSGAEHSMPGLMLTITNVGLNDKTVEGLAKYAGDEEFAWNTYVNFIMDYGSQVLGIAEEKFENLLRAKRASAGKYSLEVSELQELVAAYKNLIIEETGHTFPQDVYEQLYQVTQRVMTSWNDAHVREFRKRNRIPDTGTGVTIQKMVFGNLNELSGSGVVYSRDPKTGEKLLAGEIGRDTVGESIVGGRIIPEEIQVLKEWLPPVYEELKEYADLLENFFKMIQDIEFTIENGRLYLLQTRSAGRLVYPVARIRSLWDMIRTGLLSEKEAISRISLSELYWILDYLKAPQVPQWMKEKSITKGKPAAPGIMAGKVALTLEQAQQFIKQGEKFILALKRSDKSHEEIIAHPLCAGVIEKLGGVFSHASSLMRRERNLRPCVIGILDLDIFYERKKTYIRFSKGNVVSPGDVITVDGNTGEIYLGDITPKLDKSIVTRVLQDSADSFRGSGDWQLYEKVQTWIDKHWGMITAEKENIKTVIQKWIDNSGQVSITPEIQDILERIKALRPELMQEKHLPFLVATVNLLLSKDRLPEVTFIEPALDDRLSFFLKKVFKSVSTEEGGQIFELLYQLDPELVRKLLYNPFGCHNELVKILSQLGRKKPTLLAKMLELVTINVGALTDQELNTYILQTFMLYTRFLIQLPDKALKKVLLNVSGNTLAGIISEFLVVPEHKVTKADEQSFYTQYRSWDSLAGLLKSVVEQTKNTDDFWRQVAKTDTLRKNHWMSHRLQQIGIVPRGTLLHKGGAIRLSPARLFLNVSGIITLAVSSVFLSPDTALSTLSLWGAGTGFLALTINYAPRLYYAVRLMQARAPVLKNQSINTQLAGLIADIERRGGLPNNYQRPQLRVLPQQSLSPKFWRGIRIGHGANGLVFLHPNFLSLPAAAQRAILIHEIYQAHSHNHWAATLKEFASYFHSLFPSATARRLRQAVRPLANRLLDAKLTAGIMRTDNTIIIHILNNGNQQVQYHQELPLGDNPSDTVYQELAYVIKELGARIDAAGIIGWPETEFDTLHSLLWEELDIKAFAPESVPAKYFQAATSAEAAAVSARNAFADTAEKVLVGENGQVNVNPLGNLSSYTALLGKKRLQRYQALAELARRQDIRTVYINSTPQGGGVAIMRHGILRWAKLLKIPMRWLVMAPDKDGSIFNITKMMHNILQGVLDTPLKPEDFIRHEQWAKNNAKRFVKHLQWGNVFVIDDPQPGPIIAEIKKINPEAKIIWRCHIQLDVKKINQPGSAAHQVWQYIQKQIQDADLLLFHEKSFIPAGLDPGRVIQMYPAMVPLDGMNKPLRPWQINYYDRLLDEILTEQKQTPLDLHRPRLIQIARFDPSKGIEDVLESFRILRKRLQPICNFFELLNKPLSFLSRMHFPLARHLQKTVQKIIWHLQPQLIIMGNRANDDPDFKHLYQATLAKKTGASETEYKGIPEPIKSRFVDKDASVRADFAALADDIKVILAPHNDQLLNAAMRRSHIALQLSHKEGFEFKVTEALQKGVPLIAYQVGGIPAQILSGITGYLVKQAGDTETVADHLFRLMINPLHYWYMKRNAAVITKTNYIIQDNAANILSLAILLKNKQLSKADILEKEKAMDEHKVVDAFREEVMDMAVQKILRLQPADKFRKVSPARGIFSWFQKRIMSQNGRITLRKAAVVIFLENLLLLPFIAGASLLDLWVYSLPPGEVSDLSLVGRLLVSLSAKISLGAVFSLFFNWMHRDTVLIYDAGQNRYKEIPKTREHVVQLLIMSGTMFVLAILGIAVSSLLTSSLLPGLAVGMVIGLSLAYTWHFLWNYGFVKWIPGLAAGISRPELGTKASTTQSVKRTGIKISWQIFKQSYLGWTLIMLVAAVNIASMILMGQPLDTEMHTLLASMIMVSPFFSILSVTGDTPFGSAQKWSQEEINNWVNIFFEHVRSDKPINWKPLQAADPLTRLQITDACLRRDPLTTLNNFEHFKLDTFELEARIPAPNPELRQHLTRVIGLVELVPALFKRINKLSETVEREETNRFYSSARTTDLHKIMALIDSETQRLLDEFKFIDNLLMNSFNQIDLYKAKLSSLRQNNTQEKQELELLLQKSMQNIVEILQMRAVGEIKGDQVITKPTESIVNAPEFQDQIRKLIDKSISPQTILAHCRQAAFLSYYMEMHRILTKINDNLSKLMSRIDDINDKRLSEAIVQSYFAADALANMFLYANLITPSKKPLAQFPEIKLAEKPKEEKTSRSQKPQAKMSVKKPSQKKATKPKSATAKLQTQVKKKQAKQKCEKITTTRVTTVSEKPRTRSPELEIAVAKQIKKIVETNATIKYLLTKMKDNLFPGHDEVEKVLKEITAVLNMEPLLSKDKNVLQLDSLNAMHKILKEKYSFFSEVINQYVVNNSSSSDIAQIYIAKNRLLEQLSDLIKGWEKYIVPQEKFFPVSGAYGILPKSKQTLRFSPGNFLLSIGNALSLGIIFSWLLSPSTALTSISIWGAVAGLGLILNYVPRLWYLVRLSQPRAPTLQNETINLQLADLLDTIEQYDSLPAGYKRPQLSVLPKQSLFSSFWSGVLIGLGTHGKIKLHRNFLSLPVTAQRAVLLHEIYEAYGQGHWQNHWYATFMEYRSYLQTSSKQKQQLQKVARAQEAWSKSLQDKIRNKIIGYVTDNLTHYYRTSLTSLGGFIRLLLKEHPEYFNQLAQDKTVPYSEKTLGYLTGTDNWLMHGGLKELVKENVDDLIVLDKRQVAVNRILTGVLKRMEPIVHELSALVDECLSSEQAKTTFNEKSWKYLKIVRKELQVLQQFNEQARRIIEFQLKEIRIIDAVPVVKDTLEHMKRSEELRNITLTFNNHSKSNLLAINPNQLSDIIQELVKSAVKNGAKNISVTIEQEKDMLLLSIRDDGIKLENTNQNDPKTLPFHSMSYSRTINGEYVLANLLAKSLKGKFEIKQNSVDVKKSELTLTLKLPIHAKAKPGKFLVPVKRIFTSRIFASRFAHSERGLIHFESLRLVHAFTKKFIVYLQKKKSDKTTRRFLILLGLGLLAKAISSITTDFSSLSTAVLVAGSVKSLEKIGPDVSRVPPVNKSERIQNKKQKGPKKPWRKPRKKMQKEQEPSGEPGKGENIDIYALSGRGATGQLVFSLLLLVLGMNSLVAWIVVPYFAWSLAKVTSTLHNAKMQYGWNLPAWWSQPVAAYDPRKNAMVDPATRNIKPLADASWFELAHEHFAHPLMHKIANRILQLPGIRALAQYHSLEEYASAAQSGQNRWGYTFWNIIFSEGLAHSLDFLFFPQAVVHKTRTKMYAEKDVTQPGEPALIWSSAEQQLAKETPYARMSQKRLNYLGNIWKAISQVVKIRRAFYPAAGSDISTLMLTGDPDFAMMVDKQSFGNAEDIVASEKYREPYWQEKEREGKEGWMFTKSLEKIGNLIAPLTWELEMIGATDIRITRISPTEHRIQFLWGRTPQTVRPREIIYISECDLDKIEKYPSRLTNYLNKFYDLYLQKGAEGYQRSVGVDYNLSFLNTNGIVLSDLEIKQVQASNDYEHLSTAQQLTLFPKMNFGYGSGVFLFQKKAVPGSSRFIETLQAQQRVMPEHPNEAYRETTPSISRWYQKLLISTLFFSDTRTSGNLQLRLPLEGLHNLLKSGINLVKGLLIIAWASSKVKEPVIVDDKNADLQDLMRKNAIPDKKAATAFAKHYGLPVEPVKIRPISQLKVKEGLFTKFMNFLNLGSSYREVGEGEKPTLYLPDKMLKLLLQGLPQKKGIHGQWQRWLWLGNRYLLGMLMRYQSARYYADNRIDMLNIIFASRKYDMAFLQTDTALSQIYQGQPAAEVYRSRKSQKTALSMYDVLKLAETYLQEGELLLGKSETSALNLLQTQVAEILKKGAEPSVDTLIETISTSPELAQNLEAGVWQEIVYESRNLSDEKQQMVMKDLVAGLIDSSQRKVRKVIARGSEHAPMSANEKIYIYSMPAAYKKIIDRIKLTKKELNKIENIDTRVKGLLARLEYLQKGLEACISTKPGNLVNLDLAIGEVLLAETMRLTDQEKPSIFDLGEDVDTHHVGLTTGRVIVHEVNGIQIATRQVYEISSPDAARINLKMLQNKAALSTAERITAKSYDGRQKTKLPVPRAKAKTWLRPLLHVTRILPEEIQRLIHRRVQRMDPIGYLHIMLDGVTNSPLKQLLADGHSPVGQAYLRWVYEPNITHESQYLRALVRVLKAQRVEILEVRKSADSTQLNTMRLQHEKSVLTMIQLCRELAGLSAGIRVGDWKQLPQGVKDKKIVLPGILMKAGNLGTGGVLLDILRSLETVEINNDIFKYRRRRLFRTAAQAA